MLQTWCSQLYRFGCIWCILGLWIIIIVIKLRVVWKVLAYHPPFWWKPWWPDPSGHFQVSLPLHLGVTGRHPARDAGVTTRSVSKIRRSVEWRTFLLALALILNYMLKDTEKCFGTGAYNAALASPACSSQGPAAFSLPGGVGEAGGADGYPPLSQR